MGDPQGGSDERLDAYRRIIALADCPVDGGVRVVVEGHELAVFRLSDPEGLYVIDNECPHAGGDLAAGRVERGMVYCPWHEWGFSLVSGISTHSSEARVKTYPCCVRDGDVYARL